MWRKGLIAIGAIALLTIGLGVFVWVGVARDRLRPTPPATEASQNGPSVSPITSLPEGWVTAVGTVREYTPGALIIVLAPIEGRVEQVIMPDGVTVLFENGAPATLNDIVPGQALFSEGPLDALGRMIAERVILVGAYATPTPEATPTGTPEPTPTPTPAPGQWRAEFYGNSEFLGAPAHLRYDDEVRFDWGSAPPAPDVPAGRFSSRWTVRRAFEGGTYRFYAQSDDGARVYVDGRLVVDGWSGPGTTVFQGEVLFTSGEHDLRVDHYNVAGEARLSVWWERTGVYPNWRAEFYDNPALQGAPVVVRDEAEISHDWGEGSPAPGVPTDSFSVRWTREISLAQGPYRFIASAEDGIRVWVNDIPIIDAWQAPAGTKHLGHLWLDAGTHRLHVEAYDNAGRASAHFTWQLLDSFANWRGEYYPNPDLQGHPAFVRDDAEVRFDWGLGPPGAGLPADNFSARWTRSLDLVAGGYRFWALADDGVRVYLSGQLIIDEWQDSGITLYEVERVLEAGSYELVVEYYERGENARVEFGWEALAAPTPTPTATEATPEATPSVTPTPTAAETSTPTPTASS